MDAGTRQLQRSLDRRCERLDEPALGTAIADNPQEFLPTRSDAGQSRLFHGASEPRLRPTAFEVDGHALFHRSVAFGTRLRPLHQYLNIEWNDWAGLQSEHGLVPRAWRRSHQSHLRRSKLSHTETSPCRQGA